MDIAPRHLFFSPKPAKISSPGYENPERSVFSIIPTESHISDSALASFDQ
jgi:hypothetical protein